MENIINRNTDGTINLEVSLTAFAQFLSDKIEQERLIAEEVGVAVHAVFDENKGKTIVMPAVISFTMRKLNTPNEQFDAMTKAIGDWVRNSPEFEVNKGKGGGVCRVCDIVPKEDKASKKSKK